jgi:phosphohistidine phosphatase
MKTLLVVRHAKSSWANFGEADFDRSLNDRGKRDAPEMAMRLINKKIRIDAFISSPAKRAKMTCEAFCDMYRFAKSGIIFKDNLYHAPSHVFYEVIDGLDVTADTIAVFAHNPGITDFVNTLTKHNVDNMPTCAVFAVQADIKEWREFGDAEKKFLFFDYPKSQ